MSDQKTNNCTVSCNVDTVASRSNSYHWSCQNFIVKFLYSPNPQSEELISLIYIKKLVFTTISWQLLYSQVSTLTINENWRILLYVIPYTVR